MSLFKKPSDSEGGQFGYRPTQAGMFKGTIVKLEPCEREKYGEPGVFEDAVRWYIELRNLDGSDIIDPDTGAVAVVQTRTSTSLHKRANGRAYFEAALSRNITESDDPDVLAEEALNKDVMLQIKPNTNNNLAISLMLPFVKLG